MPKDLFDLDDDLISKKKDDLFDLDNSLMDSKYKEDFERANVYCIREKYDDALKIYNKILDEDYKCLDAYIGILKVHSLNYTKYDGDEIEKDIRIINKLFPNINDEEVLSYLDKRKSLLNNRTEIKGDSNNNYYTRDDKTIYFGSYYINNNSEKEKLKWLIIEEKDDKAFIITDKIIDSRRFDKKTNNYEESEIREWLNNEFLNIAFNEIEKNNILVTLVDNSSESTLSKNMKYACNNTNDKIFLLSALEFSDFKIFNKAKAEGTLFAISNGLFTSSTSYASWWLRSPNYYDYNYVQVIVPSGERLYSDDTDYTNVGVRPACWIKL